MTSVPQRPVLESLREESRRLRESNAASNGPHKNDAGGNKSASTIHRYNLLGMASDIIEAGYDFVPSFRSQVRVIAKRIRQS